MDSRTALVPGLLVTVLAGCATPSLHLYPDEDGGTQGAVAILESNGRTKDTVIDIGGTRTFLGTRTVTRALKAGRIDKRQAALLEFLPPKAATFVLEFEEDSPNFTPESLIAVQQVKAELRRRSGADMEVIGSVSTGISTDRDSLLSELLAEAALEGLVAQGISREIMTAFGRPSAAPLLSQDDRVEEGARKFLLVVR